MAVTQRSIATGALWTYGFSGLMLISQVMYTFASARLLTPGDFGPYALAVSTAQVGSYFVGSGVIQAVLQARDNSRESRLTATSLVIVAGTIVGLVVSCLGLYLFQQPGSRVTAEMLLVLAWMPMAAGISGVATASMRRSGRFRLPSLLEAVGLILGLVMSLVCILLGIGALSLAIGSIMTPVITAVVSWVCLREAPRLRASLLKHNELFKVATHIAGQNLLHYVQYTLPLWTLGTVGTAADVGHYSRAQAIATIPLNQLSQAFTRVVYPHLAAAKHAGISVDAPIAKSLSIGLSISGVAFGSICGLAAPLTLSFLGEQWNPAINLTALWAVFAGINLCYVAAGSALESQGKFADIWRVQCISLGLMLPAMIIVYFVGVEPARILIAAIGIQAIAHIAQIISLVRADLLRWQHIMHVYVHGILLFGITSLGGLYVSTLTSGLGSPFASLILGGCGSFLLAIVFLICTYRTTSTRNVIAVFNILKVKRKREANACDNTQ